MKKVVLAVLVIVGLLAAWSYATYPPPRKALGMDLVEYYQDHDRTPQGKVGILFTGLMMPERLENQPDLFYHLAVKPKPGKPWPQGLFQKKEDHPTVLLDRQNFYAREAFEPTELVDRQGRTADSRGVSYTEKFQKGQVTWVPSKGRLESGWFVDESERDFWPVPAQKSTVNAQLWYYRVGLNPNRMPHEKGVRDVVKDAMARLEGRYGDLEFRHVNAPIPDEVERGVHELLDSGVETLILVSTQVIHSSFKVLGEGASFYQAMQAVESWRAENGGKPVKVILAEPMGHFKPMRDAFVQLVKDRLETVPPGADVDVLLSSHGMPWDKFPNEAYPALAVPYTEGLIADMVALLSNYDLGRTRVTVSQDLYADGESDPEGKWTSTNEAYRAAVKDGFDVIITAPTSFYAESTDTLFAHALYAFNGVPGYEPFATIEYPDWNVPLVREWQWEGTKILYNGLPVGPYRQYVAGALAESVEKVLGTPL